MSVKGVDGRLYKDQASADRAAVRMANAPVLGNSSSGGNSGGSSSSGVPTKTTTGGTSGNTSSGGVSGNASSGGDVYGDVSGVRSSGVTPKDYSNYKETTLSPELNKYGVNAREMEKAKAGSISQRNDILAGNLYKQGITDKEGIRKYLNSQPGFQDTEDWEQDNTVDAIWTRMGGKDKEGETTGGTITGETTTGGAEGEFRSKAGYYYDKGIGEYMKIYGYDALSDKQKNQLDNLSEEKKKEISNRGAEALQEYLRIDAQAKRDLEQAEARQDINQDLYDINRESAIIQAEQTLRNAEESYNNLKQNWQYLGNMGMPGTSSTKIQAIGDAITEAKTTLGEVKRLTQLSLDAQEKQWEGQVLQYNQQIDNLMYDLKWKIGQEAVDALSKYTAAELEGKLDTIDGITAFRKEILDELDSNLSGITSASLTQMQMINQEYQNIANKMYDYVQNANKVNADMSKVKGFYVDGNGNPILNNQGQPIQVPQDAPMEPVFDKETGKLITFGLDENGQIVASVQQVYPGDSNVTQGTIVSLLEQGVSVQDILKYVPGVDLKTVTELAKVVKPIATGGWAGTNYKAVTQDAMINGLKNFVSQYAGADGRIPTGTKGGQCGHFVNNYLEKLGISRLFTDPITEKEKNINSDTPKVGSIVIMNSESQPKYGHVGIVTKVENGKIQILQSNKKGEEEIFVSTKNISDGNILGYFDPTKSIDDYNREVVGEGTSGEGGYDPTKVPLYESYLNRDYTNIGDLIKDEDFQKEAYNYGRQQGSAAALDALGIMAKMTGVSSSMEGKGIFGRMGNAYEWNKLYNQLSKKLTLNELTELKKRSGASLGAMSEGEWKILGEAASNLSKRGVATGMQDKAWNDELRALTLAAYPTEATQDNWKEVLNRHSKELMGEYYVEGSGGSNDSNSGGRQRVSGGNLG